MINTDNIEYAVVISIVIVIFISILLGFEKKDERISNETALDIIATLFSAR